MNKITALGLSERTLKLHAAGYSQHEIAADLNEKLPSKDKVSVMAVCRFLRSALPNPKDYDPRLDEGINEYNELVDLLIYIEDNLAIAETAINNLKIASAKADEDIKPKDIKAILDTTEKLVARKQAILSNLLEIKQEIYKFSAMQTIIAETMKIVKDTDKNSYLSVYQQFNNNPMIRNAYKKIPRMVEIQQSKS